MIYAWGPPMGAQPQSLPVPFSLRPCSRNSCRHHPCIINVSLVATQTLSFRELSDPEALGHIQAANFHLLAHPNLQKKCPFRLSNRLMITAHIFMQPVASASANCLWVSFTGYRVYTSRFPSVTVWAADGLRRPVAYLMDLTRLAGSMDRGEWKTKLSTGTHTHPFLSNGRTVRKNDPPSFLPHHVSITACAFLGPFLSAFRFGAPRRQASFCVFRLGSFPSCVAHRSVLYPISGPYFQQKRRTHHFRHTNTVCPVISGEWERGTFAGCPRGVGMDMFPQALAPVVHAPFLLGCEPVGSYGIHPTGLAVSIISPLILKLMLTSLHVQEYLTSPSLLGKEQI
ncbi:uncharacterized protein EI90DRAFT_2685635 [Cantharellus anzutake]|uniref:uncharacterized protein n=1 Tax=Cantharellus anzutake TaxID=1750568 RepID=UPI0019052D2D|nr:uncharacterized protein EI90DRAFT_2685635 [Cantharellus anzutake]KAF8319188.1 hypothetical protein EI90DRAFT_2685635 [Cantharellus anzutake]